MLQCVSLWVNIGERVFVSQFFVAGRNTTILLPLSAMYYADIPELQK